MARKRTIDPDIWTDDRVQQLPTLLAVLLYIGTISHADDDGRLEWNARQLYAKVFPLRDDVKIRDVEAAMVAIMESGLVEVYGPGNRYALHPAWRRHQYVNRPSKSKFPDPKDSRRSTEQDRLPSLMESVSECVSHSVSGSVNGSVNGSASDHVSPHVPSVSVSVSVSDTRPSDVRASDAERPDPQPLTTPFGLADWLWGQARLRGLIGDHRVDKRDAEVKRDVKPAKALLEVYELAEIQARAERLLDGIAAGRNATPTAAGLAKAWDWPWVAGRALQRPGDEPNSSDRLPLAVGGEIVP